MSVLLAAVLAGASAAVLLRALPSQAGPRLAGLRVGPAAVPARSCRPVALVLVLPLVVVAGPAAALLVLAGAVGAARWRTASGRSRSAAAERSGAAQGCRVLAAELAAGRTPADALRAAAEPATGATAEALLGAAAAARLGGDVPAALVAGSAGSAVTPLLRALAACWTVCATTGSGLAAAVQRLEEGLQSEQELRRTVDAELAGPRATAVLLAVLPVVGLLMAAGLGADPLHVLLETPVGLLCLTTGLALDALGLWWTQRLVARVRPP